MKKSDLLALIKKTAFLEGNFITRAGKKTNYYIDKYLFETRPDILDPLADEMIKLLPQLDSFDRLAAPELGAVAITTAISLKINKPFIIVKKQSKEYGTQKSIEGKYEAGDKFVVIEDILTTGGAVLKACDILMLQSNLKILEIIGVFNREEGAYENITAKGYKVKALFSKSDLAKC